MRHLRVLFVFRIVGAILLATAIALGLR